MERDWCVKRTEASSLRLLKPNSRDHAGSPTQTRRLKVDSASDSSASALSVREWRCREARARGAAPKAAFGVLVELTLVRSLD